MPPLAGGTMRRAEAAAREVLSNRTSPRAYDAQLLLAQSLSGQKQYAQAAIAYDDAYNRSRKGARAQDALLGLADALAAINEKKASCDTLGRLRAIFRELRPDIREGMAATRRRGRLPVGRPPPARPCRGVRGGNASAWVRLAASAPPRRRGVRRGRQPGAGGSDAGLGRATRQLSCSRLVVDHGLRPESCRRSRRTPWYALPPRHPGAPADG